MALLKTNRERTLAIALAIVLGGLGLMLGGKTLLALRQGLDERVSQAENEELECQSWIDNETYWTKRQAWLQETQPKVDEPRKDSLDFLQKLETSAKSHGLNITQKSLTDPISTDNWSATPIRLDLSGSFAALVTWLHELQTPSSFVLIRELTIKASSDPSLVDCNIEVMRCYHPDSQKGT